MDYLTTASAPIDVLQAVKALGLRPSINNVLYGLIDMAHNSIENVTAKALGEKLDIIPSLLSRYLDELLAHSCIFRVRHRGRWIYFVNDHSEWTERPKPFR